MDKLDIPIKVGDVRIEKGDLIFGDYDGVIVIPSKVEKEAIEKSVKIAELESRIKHMISRGVKVNKVLKDCGAF